MTTPQREPSYELRNIAFGLHEYFTALSLAGFTPDQAISLTHLFAVAQLMSMEHEEDEEEGGEDPLGWSPA
jgi:hypothetical protein